MSKKDLSISLAPITNDVHALKGDVEKIEVGLEAAKATAKEAKASVEALRIEFEQRLHMGPSSLPTTPQLSARQATILFGGFEKDFDTACTLINSELDKTNAQRPTSQYFKGEWNGLVFCRFDNGKTAEDIIRAFSARPMKQNHKNKTCKPDLPIDKRVCASLLLGLRRQLIAWGFDRRAVKVDDAIPVLSFSGKPVATASVKENKVVTEWIDTTWGAWQDLQEAPEFKKLVADNNNRLAKAGESSKGGGKGKSKE